MGRCHITSIILRAVFALSIGVTISPAHSKEQNPFPAAGQLRKQVDFWKDIFSRYSTDQAVLHDARCVECVYEVVDLRPLKHSPRLQQKVLKQTREKWRRVLLSLHKKIKHGIVSAPLTADEELVYKQFLGLDEPRKFQRAAELKRIRYQYGLRERFIEAIVESGRYLPRMEKIFLGTGLPVELTRLPFVESSFNIRARSKVGASGIWQFMPSTAKLYLRMNASVDERNDPIRATEAAAKLLRDNYEQLGAWPLAVTAYNHGRAGVARAVRMTGTKDLERIVQTYQSRSFGFASSNFYAAFVAAVEIEAGAEKHFGKIIRAEAEPTFEVVLPRSIQLADLVSLLRVNEQSVRTYNPGLLPSVFTGKRELSAGYQLRLPLSPSETPESASRIFLAGFNRIPPSLLRKSPRGLASSVVRPTQKISPKKQR